MAAGATGAAGAAAGAADSPAAESVSKTTSSAPTGIESPGAPASDTIRPLTGAGTSTTALSVDISTSGWSSLTTSPAFARQFTISADTVPSPRSGTLKT